MTERLPDRDAAYASRWTYAPGPRKTYLCPYCNEGAVLRAWGVVVDRFLNVCHEECLDRAMRMADCGRAQAGATPSGTPAHDGESRPNRGYRLSKDPLEGADCGLCGATADNFHVPDDLWERVGLGNVQACFKCFRIAAFHAGADNDSPWQVRLG